VEVAPDELRRARRQAAMKAVDDGVYGVGPRGIRDRDDPAVQDRDPNRALFTRDHKDLGAVITVDDGSALAEEVRELGLVEAAGKSLGKAAFRSARSHSFGRQNADRRFFQVALGHDPRFAAENGDFVVLNEGAGLDVGDGPDRPKVDIYVRLGVVG